MYFDYFGMQADFLFRVDGDGLIAVQHDGTSAGIRNGYASFVVINCDGASAPGGHALFLVTTVTACTGISVEQASHYEWTVRVVMPEAYQYDVVLFRDKDKSSVGRYFVAHSGIRCHDTYP